MKSTGKLALRALAIIALLNCSTKLKAQGSISEKTTPQTHISLGFNLSDVQGSFGYGLNVTSPYFLHNSVAVRASANFHCIE